MQGRRVVITGMGVISAVGNTVDEFWDNIVNCRSGIAPMTMIDTEKVRIPNGAEVKNYNPKDHFEKKELDMLDRFAQFCLYSAREAVKTVWH
jgi:3-oxoacyl-[acyl-carrier-protein] synthase II